VLVLLAVLEATIFPAPTEALVIALTLAQRRRAWLFALLATLGSVAGGLLGYAAGHALFDEIARPLLDRAGLLGELDALGRLYARNVWLALLSSGYTPIPYMLYTFAGGAFDIPLGPFVIGSLVGRGLKYAPLALLTYLFGPSVRRILERYTLPVAIAVVVLVALALLLRG